MDLQVHQTGQCGDWIRQTAYKTIASKISAQLEQQENRYTVILSL